MSIFPKIITQIVLFFLLGIGSVKASDVQLVNVNDWGSGFNATFEYEVQPSDTTEGGLEAWLIEVDYSGSAQINNAWMSGFNGGVDFGYTGPNNEYQSSQPRMSLEIHRALKAQLLLMVTIK